MRSTIGALSLLNRFTDDGGSTLEALFAGSGFLPSNTGHLPRGGDMANEEWSQ
jgi:hypothetical protein